MSGKCLGIVELAQIDLAVAKRAEAFGCKISYLARAEKSELPYKFHATVTRTCQELRHASAYLCSDKRDNPSCWSRSLGCTST
jgi:lactate dehydrogenase-like 2-hydroxyacid dehydrogenase